MSSVLLIAGFSQLLGAGAQQTKHDLNPSIPAYCTNIMSSRRALTNIKTGILRCSCLNLLRPPQGLKY